MLFGESLVKVENSSIKTDDWTFASAQTRELTHCYHDYPARMIPQVAGKLLDVYAPDAKLMFDPYCGSGTSLVEGMKRGLNVVGTDLNPLACLIAGTKTITPDLSKLDSLFHEFDSFISSPSTVKVPEEIAGVSRLDFWFKSFVIRELSIIKSFIENIEDEAAKLFFKVAFSETVRESSNTRNEEFKLYRYDDSRLEKFNPDVFGIIHFKLKRNRAGLQQFLAYVHKLKAVPHSTVYRLNSTEAVPPEVQSITDIVVTSPPYGDSQTTVAYGQYSRLSAAWLGLEQPESVDRRLMGGKTIKQIPFFASDKLNTALKLIERASEKRALEVAAFYLDLDASIVRVAQAIRVGGYACYVVANRKVKGIVLPTDDAVQMSFEQLGFNHLKTHHRSIPNKRMPLRNSPTNIPGAIENTMITEQIVVMQRIK